MPGDCGCSPLPFFITLSLKRRFRGYIAKVSDAAPLTNLVAPLSRIAPADPLDRTGAHGPPTAKPPPGHGEVSSGGTSRP